MRPQRETGISGKARLGAVSVALFLGVAGSIVGLTDWDQRLSSRVLDLLPSSDHSIERRFMVGVLRDRQANQIRIAVTGLPDDQQDAAGDFVEDVIRKSGAVDPDIPTDQELFDRVARVFYENRLSLLLPHWLAQKREEWLVQGGNLSFHDWLARRIADDLDQFLTSPDGFFFSDLVTSDPLLLLPGLQDSVAQGMASMGGSVRTAQLSGSAFDPDNQSLISEVVAGLEEELARVFPGARLLVSGTVLFAGHSRTAIRAEVGRINLGSILMVLLVAIVCLRNPIGLIGLVPVAACGLTGGLVGVVYLFGQVHIMSLVMGAFLAGITVDYGFHAFMCRAGDEPSRLWKPLTVAVGSTAAGFAILLFATLPVIRQLGAFVMTGLVCAFLAAVVLKPAIRSNLVRTRPAIERPLMSGPPGRWHLLLLAIFMATVAGGVFRIEWRDDIRELDIPSPELLSTDRAIRDLTETAGDGTAYLTTGQSYLKAIAHFRAFEADRAEGGFGAPMGLASVLPTSGELQAAREFLDDAQALQWIETLGLELERIGCDASAFDPFFRSWSDLRTSDLQDLQVETQLRAMSDLLTGPASFLMIEADGIHAVASVASDSAKGPDGNLDPNLNTIKASQLENLNQVFSRYRREIWGFLLAGLSVAAIGVLVIYRLAAGIRILMVPIASTLTAFGALGWMIQGLNLFHLLAGLLGFCLALDYALFAWEARRRREAPPVSIRVSGLTTLAAFGVLATSRLPAVSALGLTVGLIVLVTLIIIELLSGPRNVDSDHAVD